MSLIRNFIYNGESIDKGYVETFYCIDHGQKITIHYVENGIAITRECRVLEIEKEKTYSDVTETIFLEDL